MSSVAARLIASTAGSAVRSLATATAILQQQAEFVQYIHNGVRTTHFTAIPSSAALFPDPEICPASMPSRALTGPHLRAPCRGSPRLGSVTGPIAAVNQMDPYKL